MTRMVVMMEDFGLPDGKSSAFGNSEIFIRNDMEIWLPSKVKSLYTWLYVKSLLN